MRPQPQPLSASGDLASLNIASFTRGRFVHALALLAGLATCWATQQVHAQTVIEAESAKGANAAIYRDENASGKSVSVLLLGSGKSLLSHHAMDLPAGDYEVTAWLDVEPLYLMHKLSVVFSAGSSQWNMEALQFDSSPGYHPYTLRVTHLGGALPITIEATGSTGFDGMRPDNTAEEKNTRARIDDRSKLSSRDEFDELDGFQLEEEPPIGDLTPLDMRVVCDRIQIKPLRTPVALVSDVNLDKVHYRPGESAKAAVHVVCPGGGTFQFVADVIAGIDDRRRVFESEVTLEAKQPQEVAFAIELDQNIEMGHELRCTLLLNGKELHSRSEYFGVSRNVYRMGITGAHGPHAKRNLSREYFRALMQNNKNAYANYFEVFAWAPSDYSNLTPETEYFWSGQTQYAGSVTAFKLLLEEAHKLGIKGVTYGSTAAGGIAGFNTLQRHPDIFGHDPVYGPVSQAYNTFYLERMVHNEYEFPEFPDVRRSFWQHWGHIWAGDANADVNAAVDFGSDQIIATAREFGWDGVRYDFWFHNRMDRAKARILEALPDFFFGFNIAFAQPGSELFLPPKPVEDFHINAANHGLIMDESVRDYSNTNFSSGVIKPFYEAIAREANYVKRIGGLPLFITFDMGSELDKAFNVLCGLAAGQRYTYVTSPGDFAFGTLPKWLTRYAAFVWDDSAMVADAASTVRVQVGQTGSKHALPWWDHSTWLRKLPDGRQQLIVNLLNPPNYDAFCNRVQTPPAAMQQVSVSVATPAGAKLTRVMHASPDLTSGHEMLEVQPGDQPMVVIPQLRTWSLVVFEYASAVDGQPLAYPVFKLTTPVEDAKAHTDAQLAAQPASEPREAAKPPYYLDFAHKYNVDEAAAAKLKQPEDLNLRRDGKLDVHHSRGPFSWFNPVENAVGLLGGGNFRASWIDYVGFKDQSDGCMDEFPETLEALLQFDVLVLDNVHARTLGPRRRAMIAEFVRNGGGLLYVGGYYNFSMGGERNTALDPLLPVEVTAYRQLVQNNAGMPLTPVDTDFFKNVTWTGSPMAFSVDTSQLRPGVRVLAKVGDHPAIVAHEVGKGRVVSLLMNVHGDYPQNVTPYWQWSQWTRVLASTVAWLAQDYRSVYQPKLAKPQIDPSKVNPEDLMFEASLLDGNEFNKQLRSAIHNMIDPETSRIVLEVALTNVDKISDQETLALIAESAGRFVDASFAPLAQKLLSSPHLFLRRSGYQVLGLAGDKGSREQIERGLEEKAQSSDTSEQVRTIRTALIALARLDDPASIAAVRAYLTRGGTQRLLALSVLHRLGDDKALEQALPVYVHELRHHIALKCYRRYVYDDLAGGVSFKLTPAARRKLEQEYDYALELETQADEDLRYFRDTVAQLTDAQLTTVITFLTQAESPNVASLAYRVLGSLPEGKAAALRSQFAQARLPALQQLAQP